MYPQTVKLPLHESDFNGDYILDCALERAGKRFFKNPCIELVDNLQVFSEEVDYIKGNEDKRLARYEHRPFECEDYLYFKNNWRSIPKEEKFITLNLILCSKNSD